MTEAAAVLVVKLVYEAVRHGTLDVRCKTLEDMIRWNTAEEAVKTYMDFENREKKAPIG
jgi:hypothetical protein